MDLFPREAADWPLVLISLDIKIKRTPSDLWETGGRDLARKIIKWYWQGSKNKKVLKDVLISLPNTKYQEFVFGFLSYFSGQEELLSHVVFDISENESIDDIVKFYKKMGIVGWIGVGITNWFEVFRGHGRLLQAIRERDTPGSPVKKVYRWTIDRRRTMNTVLDLSVDAFITNKPSKVSQILDYRGDYRLASRSDNVSAKF